MKIISNKLLKKNWMLILISAVILFGSLFISNFQLSTYTDYIQETEEKLQGSIVSPVDGAIVDFSVPTELEIQFQIPTSTVEVNELEKSVDSWQILLFKEDSSWTQFYEGITTGSKTFLVTLPEMGNYVIKLSLTIEVYNWMHWDNPYTYKTNIYYSQFSAYQEVGYNPVATIIKPLTGSSLPIGGIDWEFTVTDADDNLKSVFFNVIKPDLTNDSLYENIFDVTLGIFSETGVYEPIDSGTYIFQLSAQDSYGGWSSPETVTFEWDVNQAPIIENFATFSSQYEFDVAFNETLDLPINIVVSDTEYNLADISIVIVPTTYLTYTTNVFSTTAGVKIKDIDIVLYFEPTLDVEMTVGYVLILTATDSDGLQAVASIDLVLNFVAYEDVRTKVPAGVPGFELSIIIISMIVIGVIQAKKRG